LCRRSDSHLPTASHLFKLIFDSSLLHATGENKSNFDRNCLTITLTKVYCKPQFNYKVLYDQEEIKNIDPKIQDILNINSQIFENLEDFYNKKYFHK
jgi:ectoine hydroxylase-related dioxygenase (phytanoyl-CoA dioxygenase family)